ncbi:hypothetical protein [Streptomyces sp. NRRL S-15]|uniref:hypothetical protein n=1 Tax=Streptomyces sp. NRRL S-15 TaxID=1463886 RepID=UPI00131C035A|nr:hypothetical protein [Streptomyces sp. NRRL S-15]
MKAKPLNIAMREHTVTTHDPYHLNMVASFASGAALAHLVCGVVAGFSLIALAMHRLRGRR